MDRDYNQKRINKLYENCKARGYYKFQIKKPNKETWKNEKGTMLLKNGKDK